MGNYIPKIFITPLGSVAIKYKDKDGMHRYKIKGENSIERRLSIAYHTLKELGFNEIRLITRR